VLAPLHGKCSCPIKVIFKTNYQCILQDRKYFENDIILSIISRLSHICAILNGMAGIVIFSAPSAVSSAWFPPGERTTATGIAIVFNNLGNAVSFLLAPAIVPDPPENR